MARQMVISSRQVATLRITFGVVWLIDAFFKWQPGFLNGFGSDVMMAAQSQPAWLSWWFDLGMNSFMHYSHVWAVLIAIIETLIGLGLVFGVARLPIYVGGMVFSFLIWGIGEGFGGPYGSDSTDIGAAVIYIFVFWALVLLDRAVSPTWSLRDIWQHFHR